MVYARKNASEYMRQKYKLLLAIAKEPGTFEDLIHRTSFNDFGLSVLLELLETDKYICQLKGGKYKATKSGFEFLEAAGYL